MAQEMAIAPKPEVDRPERGERTRTAVVYRPNTDIYETGDRVVMTLDLPGVAPQDLEVTLERRLLTIRGRTPTERHDGFRLYYAECGVGDFERVFALSENIDREHIQAHHRNGVLTLELPKSAAARTKRIEVKAA